jgi:hypothetical protein
MNKRFSIGIPFISFLLVLYSCRCDCQCSKNLGCAVLTVRKVNGITITDTVIATKTYCSTNDYYTDQSLQDSILAFKKQYNTDKSTVYVKDSIYKQYETIEHVKCGGTYQYTNQGYGCSCAK